MNSFERIKIVVFYPRIKLRRTNEDFHPGSFKMIYLEVSSYAATKKLFITTSRELKFTRVLKLSDLDFPNRY